MDKKSVMSIIVKVDGEEFETFFDEKGVQRFKINSLFKYIEDTNQINHRELTIGYQLNKFSLKEYALLKMGLGCSVSELTQNYPFNRLTIENPADYNKEGGP